MDRVSKIVSMMYVQFAFLTHSISVSLCIVTNLFFMPKNNSIGVQFYILFKLYMRCVQSYANTWYSSNFVNQVLCFNCQRSLAYT